MPQKIGLIFATVCRYISSTTTSKAFSFYQQYCGPSVLVWLFCRSVVAPRRWRRQTHPSGFSVWARSILRRLPLLFCPPGRGHPLPGQAALCAVPVRWGPWRLAAGRTGCPPAAQVWADNAVGSPGPIFHQCSGRKRGWRRWSTAGVRQSVCSRSDATYRIHPEVERKIKVNALPRQEAYHFISLNWVSLLMFRGFRNARPHEPSQNSFAGFQIVISNNKILLTSSWGVLLFPEAIKWNYRLVLAKNIACGTRSAHFNLSNLAKVFNSGTPCPVYAVQMNWKYNSVELLESRASQIFENSNYDR